MVSEEIHRRDAHDGDHQRRYDDQTEEHQDKTVGDEAPDQRDRTHHSIMDVVHESIKVGEQSVDYVRFMLFGAIAHT